MTRSVAFAFFAVSCLFANSLSGLTVQRNAHGSNALFGIQFPGEGRSIYLHQNRVSSISIHEYVTAVFRVHELVVDTVGSTNVRIYHTRPLTAEELMGQFESAVPSGAGATLGRGPSGSAARAVDRLAERVQSGLTARDTMVVKEYPVTTHARTVEFKVSDRAELLALYGALTAHWSNSEDEEAQPDSEGNRPTLQLGRTLFIVER